MTHRLLLDVSSLTYRAYFALKEPGVFAKDGRPVGAVHGYLDMVTKLIVDRRPDEVVHVYDHDWRPITRTDMYPGYKAARPPEPEDLTPQFKLLREVLDRTGMLQAQTEGWEAEDAIGAFCLEASDDDRIDIVSGDRDLIQLVRDPVVRLLFTVRGVSELAEYDEAGVLAKYGVSASRYGEFAILRGDPSDGLPGRPRRRREDRARSRAGVPLDRRDARGRRDRHHRDQARGPHRSSWSRATIWPRCSSSCRSTGWRPSACGPAIATRPGCSPTPPIWGSKARSSGCSPRWTVPIPSDLGPSASPPYE